MFATATTSDKPPKILRNPPPLFFDSSSGIFGKVGSGIGAGAAGAAPGMTSTIGSLEVTAGTTSTAGFARVWLGLLGVIGSILKPKIRSAKLAKTGSAAISASSISPSRRRLTLSS